MADSDEVETPAVRQRHELEALLSIYYGFIEDLRPNAKLKADCPTKVKVQLRPQESMTNREFHVGIDLIVKCSLLYPDVVPDIQLDNAKGLSKVQVGQLKEELQNLARKCIGEVMIHQLCLHIEAFLHAYNKAPPASFHDQMLSNNLQLERRAAEEQRKRLEEQRLHEVEMMENEIRRQSEGLREEAKMRRQADGDRKSSSTEADCQNSPPVVTYLDPSEVKATRRSSLEDRPIMIAQRGNSPQKASLAGSLAASVRESVVGGRNESEGSGSSFDDTEPSPGGELDNGDDDVPFLPSLKDSRLQKDFRSFKRIGRGAFGDVIRAQNILDGNLYAIKRIPFDPNRKQLVLKITREVKLLSRLNHENVVRYFTSWLETAVQAQPSTADSSYTASPTGRASNNRATPSRRAKSKSKDRDQKLTSRDVDSEGEEGGGVREGSSFGGWGGSQAGGNSGDGTPEEDNDFFGASFRINSDDSDDDGIVFEDGDEPSPSAETETKVNLSDEDDSSTPNQAIVVQRLRFLYIQMEYCDKKTLRDCIDEGVLYLDEPRVWQLFREILEGLQHIHDQGMIHRDLKPMNVFLTVKNIVKIGDFGLATTGMNPVLGGEGMNVSGGRAESPPPDGSLTGTVGTTLYVAPEVMDNSTHYNQKVDLYSLGVMFFEMCYRPLSTGMERIKVLTALRAEGATVQLPDDFDKRAKKHQVCAAERLRKVEVLWLLLSHDPSRRPTCKDLLQSDLLPPARMAETECIEMLRKTIATPHSRAFKPMLATIFAQPVPTVTEFGYDVQAYKLVTSRAAAQPQGRVHHALVQRHVTDTLERIFRRHGAVSLSLPLLMPRCALYADTDTYVTLMDHSGCLVALPYDSRIPFARFVARTGITSLKRYSIERVYRANRTTGMHPRELLACSFDIVSPSPVGCVADAELVRVVHEIVEEFGGLRRADPPRSYRLRLNHVSVLRAVLLHCEVPPALHAPVCAILGDSKVERQRKEQMQTRLCSLGLPNKAVDALYAFLEREEPFAPIKGFLACVTKTKGEAASLAKEGLHELELILQYIETLQCKFQPFVALGLVINIHQYSGALFQVVADVKNRNKTSLDVLAVGGRYDNLLAEFRPPGPVPASKPAVVGVTIAYDKLVGAVESNELTALPSLTDALVCSTGRRASLGERLTIARELWDAGVSVELGGDAGLDLEEHKEFCRAHRIEHLVVQRDADITIFKVSRSERDQMVKKDVTVSQVVDFFQPRMQSRSENVDPCPATTIKSQNSLQGYIENFGGSGGGTGPLTNSGFQSSSAPHYNVTYILAETGRPAKNTKRTYDNLISNSIVPTLAQISHKARVEVLGLELNAVTMRAIAFHLDMIKDKLSFTAGVGTLIKENQRHKKYLTRITDDILEKKFEYKSPSQAANLVIILYSLQDEVHRVLF